MIAILPTASALGELELLEAYEYFDGPKLFACKNAAGQIFLGLWIGEDELSETYLIVPCSRARFLSVRSGALTLAIAFAKPELGYLFKCSVLFSDARSEVVPLLGEQLDAELLPDANERLDLATETLPTRFAELDLPQRAAATLRDVIGLHLDFQGAKREEAPTGGLGKILVGLQESLEALGQKIEGKATLRGVIEPQILEATNTQIVQAAGGSFALEISANAAVNLFNKSLITEAIDNFVQIIEAGDVAEELRLLLIDAAPRAASKYKKFLTALISSQASLRLERASPDTSKNKHVSLSLIAAAGALKVAEMVTQEIGETRVLQGYFLGIEIPRKTFLAISSFDESEYRGKILLSALSAAANITMNRAYTLTIRETIEMTILGEERLRYELESISKIE